MLGSWQCPRIVHSFYQHHEQDLESCDPLQRQPEELLRQRRRVFHPWNHTRQHKVPLPVCFWQILCLYIYSIYVLDIISSCMWRQSMPINKDHQQRWMTQTHFLPLHKGVCDGWTDPFPGSETPSVAFCCRSECEWRTEVSGLLNQLQHFMDFYWKASVLWKWFSYSFMMGID